MNQTSQYLKLIIAAALVLVVSGLVMACQTIPAPSALPTEDKAEAAAVSSPTSLPTEDTDEATEEPAPAAEPTEEEAEAAEASPPAETEAEVAVVPPPTATAVITPTATPVLIPPDDGCVACHTDQEKLIANAKEEEVKESLSEGEG